jgi:hypothetical protein
MRHRINLFNPKNNNIEKTIFFEGSYQDAEIEVSKLNSKLKNEKYYKVTEINC